MHRQLAIRCIDYVLKRGLKHDPRHLIVIHVVSVLCLFMANLNGLRAASCASSICHELGLNASIHCAEEECCTVDSLCDSQDAMVLENTSLGTAKCFGDMYAFIWIECNTTEAGVDAMIIVESVLQSV